MKYFISQNVASANRNDLIQEIEALEVQIEGQSFIFNEILASIANYSAVSLATHRAGIFIETNFIVQGVSAGWTLKTITDSGVTYLSNFTKTSVAKFVKGTMYLVAQEEAYALQIVPSQLVLNVPNSLKGADGIAVSPVYVPYYAYEDSTPQGLTSVNVISIAYNPVLATQATSQKMNSRYEKVASATTILTSK